MPADRIDGASDSLSAKPPNKKRPMSTRLKPTKNWVPLPMVGRKGLPGASHWATREGSIREDFFKCVGDCWQKGKEISFAKSDGVRTRLGCLQN